jgi:hypothetical protein
MSKIIGYDYGSSFNTFQTTTTASTNSTSLTVVGNIPISGNTFSIGSVVRCTAAFDKVGTSGGYYLSLFWNTTPNLTGSPISLGVFSATTTTASFYGFYRTLTFTALTGSNNTFNMPAAVSSMNDLNPVASNPTNVTVDWSVDSYMLYVVRTTNASDTINFRWGKISNG